MAGLNHEIRASVSSSTNSSHGLFRWFCVLFFLWGPNVVHADVNANEGRLVTVENGRAVPAIVTGWLDAGEAIQLSVRDELSAIEVVELLNQAFPRALIAVIGPEVFVSGVDLRQLLQGMSSMWLRSAPFEDAPVESFLGCVFVDQPIATAVQASSREPQPWSIHSKGVGALTLGQTVSDHVLRRLGMTRAEFFESAAENRAGFQVVSVPEMDVQVTFLADGRVLSIEPGRSVRTQQGTGIGSTIDDLRRAHPELKMVPIPKPYMCAAVSPALPRVAFHFTDCQKACAGQSKVKTVVWDWPEQQSL